MVQHLVCDGPGPAGVEFFPTRRMAIVCVGKQGVHCGHRVAVMHGVALVKLVGYSPLVLERGGVLLRPKRMGSGGDDARPRSKRKMLWETGSALPPFPPRGMGPATGFLARRLLGVGRGLVVFLLFFPKWQVERDIGLGFLHWPGNVHHLVLWPRGVNDAFPLFVYSPSCFSQP